MSEEKELQEADLAVDQEDDGLSSFVDFADLNDLETASNQELFGDLGDIEDLGDVPDLSLDDISELPDLTEDVAVPVQEAEASHETAFHTVEPNEGISFPDLTEEEKVSLPELTAEEPEEFSMPDLGLEEEGVPIPDIELDAAEESIMPDIDLDAEEETQISDLGFDVGEEISVPDLEEGADFANGGEEVTDASLQDSLDGLETTDDGAMDDALAAVDLPSEDDFSETVEEAADALTDEIADVDLGELDALTNEESGMGDMGLGSDFLNGLDLGFTDEEAPISMEEAGGGNIDSMLDGLLDNLDMNGSIEEPVASEGEAEADDSMLDILGLDDNPFDAESLDGVSDGMEGEAQDLLDVASMMPQTDQKEEQKNGFFHRVFGNVVTDEIAEQERMAAEKEEEEAAKKAEEDAKAKEEKDARKAELQAEKEAKKEEKKKLKEAKKAEKAEKKKEKKAQREEEEAAELEVVGKLNKVGVSIIVAATILFLTVEIVGTNAFGYISSKNKAVDYFDMGKYTEAYAEALGTNMHEKDEEEYNKIKVVMKVQQSLNAYQNYDRINYYPEALDALLRGLKRYDANIDEGIELEVDSDMMSCRKQILTLLKEEFNLSEAEAYALLALDKEQYQSKVVALGVKKK